MIIFTKHALEKFAVLRRHKFRVTKQKVLKTLNKPDLIDYSRLPLLIAQSKIDRTHVLRVVYKARNGDKIVITFYPGRQVQYEKSKKSQN